MVEVYYKALPLSISKSYRVDTTNLYWKSTIDSCDWVGSELVLVDILMFDFNSRQQTNAIDRL